MNNIKFKGLGLVIISVVLMTTLLSCTKVNQSKKFDDEVMTLNITSSLEDMRSEITILAFNIEAEQLYFKDKSIAIDYDRFIKDLVKSFEDIEKDFAKAHNSVLESNKILYAKFNQSDDLVKIQLIEDELFKLVTLYEDLNTYHFMILETNVILNLFSKEVADLMNYMADGNITTIEYNLDLELIMTTYRDLLVLNDEAKFTDQFLNDPVQTEETLKSLKLAKEEILKLTTLTDIDKQVNEQVYTMFNFIEQSIQIVYDYTKSVDTQVYTDNISLRIDDGAVDYTKEILLGINQ